MLHPLGGMANDRTNGLCVVLSGSSFLILSCRHLPTLMKLHFEAPKGQRVHRYFWGVTCTSGDLWYNTTLKIWEPYRSHEGHGYSTHAPCRTLKAFKRMLRKQPTLLSESVVLVNRYKDHDVFLNHKD